jgi:cellulose synthase/poly-beta-1,6-N-acetylglucosamine synthase-like glycosyltransferase
VILPALRDGAMALAALPVLMTAINLRLLRAPPRGVPPGLAVSVVVPARDEEAAISACLVALLASTGVEAEIIVVDDHSEDRTAALVREAAARDPRVRLIEAPPLPAGWSAWRRRGIRSCCSSTATCA